MIIAREFLRCGFKIFEYLVLPKPGALNGLALSTVDSFPMNANFLLVWVLLLAAAPVAMAQSTLPNPNPDRFPQPIPTPTPLPTPEPGLSTPTPSPAPAPTPVTIPVSKVVVTGSTALKQSELEGVTRSLEGRSVTLEELRSAADAITQLYLNRGLITSRAVLVDQAIADGVIKIQVIEGSIEKIEIQGLQRLRPDYVRDRLQLGTTAPLSKDKLEDQLRLLKADPLLETVEASLRPGTGLGQSILTVRVKEAQSLTGFVGTDNFSPPSVGSERFGLGLNYQNLTGFGDTLGASYYQSTQEGSTAFDFNYRLPVNAQNGTVHLRIAPSRSKIVDPQFAAFGIRSNSDLYEISFRQPLLRTPREEFALSAAFTLQNGQTFLFQNTPFPFGIGPDADGNSRTRVLKLGQDYIRRDPVGAWALRSQFSFGLGLFNATRNADPIPDGRFFSWLGQVQRVQRLGNDHLLIAQFDVQLTPDSLLPSQQFVIGGGQSVRGFRQNSRSGDNGLRLSLEDRIAVQRDASGSPVLQLAPFLDLGTVWNKSNNPNTLPAQRFLAGGGLGLILEPIPRLTIRLDYAVPFVRPSDRGENAQDRGFYFGAGYTF
jgi:hemolysin activation/secretion protein